MENQKGQILVYLIILLTFVLLGSYFYFSNLPENKTEKQPINNKTTVKTNYLEFPKVKDRVLIPKWGENNQTKFALYDFENLKEIPLNGKEKFSYHFEVKYSESKNKVFVIDNELSKIVFYDFEKATENVLATSKYFPYGFQAQFIVSPKEDMIAFGKRKFSGWESIEVVRLDGEIIGNISFPGQHDLQLKKFNQDSSELTYRTIDNSGEYKTYYYNIASKNLTEIDKGFEKEKNLTPKVVTIDKEIYKYSAEKSLILNEPDKTYYLINGKNKIKLISVKEFEGRIINTSYHFTNDEKSFIFQIQAFGYNDFKDYKNDIVGVYKINLDGKNLQKLPPDTPKQWY